MSYVDKTVVRHESTRRRGGRRGGSCCSSSVWPSYTTRADGEVEIRLGGLSRDSLPPIIPPIPTKVFLALYAAPAKDTACLICL